MKLVNRLWLIKLIVFTPIALLFAVICNLVGYVLALSGVTVIPEAPWQYAAREFYIYHGRAIIQLQPDCVQYDEQLWYRPRDGRTTFNNYEFSTTIGSVDGHRVNPYLESLPEVIILGDSFAQGWGVNDEDTVASVLTRDHRLQALTYGVSSYGTNRELLAWRRAFAGTGHKPAHIVIFYCTNDYAENIYFLDHGVKKYAVAEYENLTNQAADHVAHRSLLVGPLSNHVASFKNGYRKWFLIRRQRLDYGNLYDPDPRVSNAEQVRAFKAVLDANRDILGDIKISVVAFKGWSGKDAFGAALAATPTLANGAVINVVLNTLPRSAYYSLDGHLNVRGNRQMAALLAERIQ